MRHWSEGYYTTRVRMRVNLRKPLEIKDKKTPVKS